MKIFVAVDNYTLEVMGEFDSLEELLEAYPSAEITSMVETDTAIIFYC